MAISSKIALVVPSNLWFCPYVRIYTQIFDEYNLSYDLICWDREGKENDEAICFQKKPGHNTASKFFRYYQFSRFVKSILKNTSYSRVIVFTSQAGLFIANFLKKYYRGRYIFDFRDVSIEQKSYFKKALSTLLGNSFANVISSPGFKQYLPKGVRYLLSHNFILSEVYKGLEPSVGESFKLPLKVLTIGGIRDMSSNSAIIDAIGDKKGITLSFVGKGYAARPLEEYALSHHYTNIAFRGFYKKNEEPEIIRDATFLNIFYPRTKVHDSSLSNRFYHSLIYRKPMIVTKGQIQGDLCEKYNLGIAISDTSDLTTKLKTWLKENDFGEYEKRCIALLKTFLDDYNDFKNMLLEFVKL